MHDVGIQPPLCSNDPGIDNCGEATLAIGYFIIFTILSAFVMINVFVAVVLKNFEDEFDRESEENQILTSEDIATFSQLWINFCENNGEEMKIGRLGTLMNLLDPPLGLSDNPLFGQELQAFIDDLHLPQSNGMVHYVDLGLALTERVFHENVGNIPEDNEFMRLLRRQLHATFPRLKKIKQSQAEEVFTAAEYRRVIQLQRYLKNRSKSDRSKSSQFSALVRNASAERLYEEAKERESSIAHSVVSVDTAPASSKKKAKDPENSPQAQINKQD